MEDFIKVGKTREVGEGKSKIFDVDGRPIAIFNSNGTFHAIDNHCPHKGAPLSDGVVMGNMVICPWHRWTFDITNGNCITNPIAKIGCYEVKVEGDDLLIRI